MKKLSVLLLVLGVLLLVSPFARPLLAQHAVHWAYEGETGPAHWGDLAPEFAVCASGTQQSPVDIPDSAALNPADITFNYQTAPLAILNNGHTIQVNYPPGSSITVGGKTYQLAQFHFHIPSEHELAGEHKDMEVHFVHKAADGELAVVGVLLVAGAENAALAPVFNNLPKQEQEAKPVEGVTVDAAAMLPAERTFYRYDGSLTTPPCTQDVKWHVMNTPVEMSQAQIDAFKAIFANDSRPVQALGARAFLLVSTLPQTGLELFTANIILVGIGIALIVIGFLLLMTHRRQTIHRTH